MARRRSRGFLLVWWVSASLPVKLTAVGLAVVLLGGVATTGLVGPFGGGPGGSATAYAHGPAQRWGSATSADAPAGTPGNRTLPETVRGRYPSVTWQQPQNEASVDTPPAPAATGFDPKTSREIPAARSAYDSTYANPDGTETTEFSTVPVNYQTPNGWQPIDTRLTSDGRSGWRNTADSVGLDFAPTAAAPVRPAAVPVAATRGVNLAGLRLTRVRSTLGDAGLETPLTLALVLYDANGA